MKKKLLLAGAVALMAAAVVTGYSVYNKTNVPDLFNANVEALASGEGNGSDFNCRCGLLWGDGCRSDNWGSKCAPSGAIYCSDYDGNCS